MIFSATRGCLVQALQGSSTYQPWTSVDIYIILFIYIYMYQPFSMDLFLLNMS